MSKKAKYKAVRSKDPYNCTVESARDIVCQRCTWTGARKITRALNAMEAKPKAKPFKFDWGLAELRFNFAAMDFDGEWYLFETKPHTKDHELWVCGGEFREIRGIKTYPGDWRDSLQQRP